MLKRFIYKTCRIPSFFAAWWRDELTVGIEVRDGQVVVLEAGHFEHVHVRGGLCDVRQGVTIGAVTVWHGGTFQSHLPDDEMVVCGATLSNEDVSRIASKTFMPPPS